MFFSKALLLAAAGLATLTAARPTLENTVKRTERLLRQRDESCPQVYKDCIAGTRIILKCCVQQLIVSGQFTDANYGLITPSCYNAYVASLNKCSAGKDQANSCTSTQCCDDAFFLGTMVTKQTAINAQMCTEAPCKPYTNAQGQHQGGYNEYVGHYAGGYDSRICFDDATQMQVLVD